MLLVVPESDVNLYPSADLTRLTARTAPAALQQLSRHPHIVVIDWDMDGIDGDEFCRAAVSARAAVLVAAADPASAPRALKAGCHALLLKPLMPMLIAARLGRLTRAQKARSRVTGLRAPLQGGTHRLCSETTCPYCGTAAPTSFEFSSHRRAWYACLSCDQVWLAARRE